MTILRALQQAFYGWIMIIRGELLWQDRFRLTIPGLATALVLFYVFAILAVVLASLDMGVPTAMGFVVFLLYQSLWLASLLIGVFGTRFAIKDRGPVLPLLVPGVYALTFYLILGALVSLAIPFLLPLLWLGLIVMLFRLGRVAGNWSFGVSAAFGVLTVLLLVGTPIALYMMPAPVPAA
ncbi:hypothetical protein SAMN06295905_0082 [Devosia lucknowensis]|uniref:Yip1 domain-containing protein n=1 Tax=Devosia lucknowensis TaxID=1096929 RepID=A0A1Y6ECW2_9HYPH|nr:hypothetical protein [Devosia lucknowensis]SMQ58452.1 hypothetical protein SAMN06295905_0082 [Devosia lucknowensis]